MGAYLSKPSTDKETSAGSNEWISYGCSSMQGWRRFQEDAHNCILDYDPKRTASFFAVYDGHGGAEVAKYCSQHLPGFILSQSGYNTDNEPINPTNLLKKAFIDFDITLTQPKARSELKIIAGPGCGDDDEDNANASEDDEGRIKPNGHASGDEDDDEHFFPLTEENIEEITELREEATRPIEAVLRKQFSGEIPAFIQNLLSTFKKSVHACPSGSSTSTSETEIPVTGVPSSAEETEAKSSSERASEDASKSAAGDKEAVSSPSKEVEGDSAEQDGAKLGSGDTGIEEANGDDVKPTAEETAEGENGSDEEEEESDDEDYDAEKEEGEFYDDGEDDDDDEEDEDDEDEDYDDEDDDESSPVAVLPRPVGFNEPGVDSGSTACVAFVLPEVSDDGESVQRVFLYVANAGDSRAVLCRAGAAVELSEDHKPEDPPERARINAAGGTVTADGRVNDGLNLSRAIGDHVYKQRSDLRMWDQMISALPDVTRTELVPGADEFVVIACDGIWNAMTSQAVVDFVYDRIHPDTAAQEIERSRKEEENSEEEKKQGEEEVDRSSPEFLAKICEELFDSCLATNTMGDGTGCDNMTCIILRFDDLKGLAAKAVTRTVAPPPDDLSFLIDSSEKEELDESMEAANALKAVQEEEDESSSSGQVVVSIVANGNGDTGEHQPLPSPSHSPVLKKARLDTSPQNGSSGVEHVNSTSAE